MTPDELAAVMADRGKTISLDSVWYHCRTPGGLLYGKARRVGRSWEIPDAAAADFAEHWEPYGSLRKTA